MRWRRKTSPFRLNGFKSVLTAHVNAKSSKRCTYECNHESSVAVIFNGQSDQSMHSIQRGQSFATFSFLGKFKLTQPQIPTATKFSTAATCKSNNNTPTWWWWRTEIAWIKSIESCCCCCDRKKNCKPLRKTLQIAEQLVNLRTKNQSNSQFENEKMQWIIDEWSEWEIEILKKTKIHYAVMCVCVRLGCVLFYQFRCDL